VSDDALPSMELAGALPDRDQFRAAVPARPLVGRSTRVLASLDDRLFPPEFQRRVAGDRFGLPADEIPGGHLVALSGPVELADRLESSPAATDPVPS